MKKEFTIAIACLLAGLLGLAAAADTPNNLADHYFVRNDGQLDARVKFYVQASGYSAYFTHSAVYFSFVQANETQFSQAPRKPGRHSLEPSSTEGLMEVIRLIPLNTAKQYRIEGEGPLRARFNYFVGRDPSQWHKDVPLYEAIVYKGVFPGIDIRFYYNSESREIEYDAVVHPGADPSRIRFAFEGIRGLQQDPDGNLLIKLRNGTLVQRLPRLHQRIGNRDVDVHGSFVMDRTAVQEGSRFAYRFRVFEYDRSTDLIIDPQIAYSTYLGGSNGDYISDIALDSSGSAYFAGNTLSPEFSATIGAFQTKFKDNMGFVIKLSPDGSALEYAAFLGPAICDNVAVDSAGAAYVSCLVDSNNFPVLNPFQSDYRGGYDITVTKLNPDGSALAYSTYLGGTELDEATGIAVDPDGNVYVAGTTDSSDFPLQDAFQTILRGDEDGFITELNQDGNALIYSTYLGGTGPFDSVLDLAVDSSGAAYVTGVTMSPDFPVTPGVVDTSCGQCGLVGNYDEGFVTKIAPGGASLTYSTYLGGSGSDTGYAIAIDGEGTAYVTGSTFSDDFPLTNPIQATKRGVGDIFVSRLSPDGTSLIYSTYLGGSDSEWGNAIAVDGQGAAYVAGFEYSADFPTVDPLPVDCGVDVFVTKINPAGSTLVYSTCLGGNWLEESKAIAADAAGAAYVVGYTKSPDFPVRNALQPELRGDDDAFVTKLQCNSIDSPQVLEGSGQAVFTVHLCAANAVDGSVDFETSDGSATAGSDYVYTAGTLTIPAGSIEGTIAVPLIDDDLLETKESFFLNLSNPVNLSLSPMQSPTVILDDDSLFYDAFDNGLLDWTTELGWRVKSEWHEGAGVLQGSSARSVTAFARTPWFPSGLTGCSICTIETNIQTAGGLGNKIILNGWFTDEKNKIELIMKQEQAKWVLRQISGGYVVAKSKAPWPILPGVSYHIQLGFDGAAFHLSIDGASVLTMVARAPAAGNIGIKIKKTIGTFGPITVY